jgi:AICAR transformylase/IMP cyclohydrolase PurH
MHRDQNPKLALRYGLNPLQREAELISDGGALPIEVLSGSPSFLNILDALRAWGLVRELRARLGRAAAASFKHVNPAGAALASDGLPQDFLVTHFLREDLQLAPLAAAYLRARHCDRISSYGDLAALSDMVDRETAEVLGGVVSDGVIAPGFSPDALAILRQKRNGNYLVLAVDPLFQPSGSERRTEFGLTLAQDTDGSEIPDPRDAQIVSRRTDISDRARDDLLLGAIVSRHTQSNAVVATMAGQTIGIGAGQQSRILATRLACDKADNYRLLSHPKITALEFQPSLGRTERINLVDMAVRFHELDEREWGILRERLSKPFDPLSADERRSWLRTDAAICLASDAFIPFRDNVDRAARSAVSHIIQTGGSLRDDEVTQAANDHGMVMLHTGRRYFLH